MDTALFLASCLLIPLSYSLHLPEWLNAASFWYLVWILLNLQTGLHILMNNDIFLSINCWIRCCNNNIWSLLRVRDCARVCPLVHRGCSSWGVISEKDNCQSCLISSSQCDDGGLLMIATIVCESVFWLCNTHTTQNHPSMINSRHLLMSSIDLVKRGLHWLRLPADYNQKDAQFEVFFKSEDTYWVLKFLP